MNIWIFMLAIVAQIASYLEYGYLLRACVAIARQELSILWGTLILLAASV